MKEEQLSFDVTMKVTKVQIELLQKFISSKSKMNIHDIDGILTRLIEEVRIKDYNIYGGVTLLDWGTWMLEKAS